GSAWPSLSVSRRSPLRRRPGPFPEPTRRTWPARSCPMSSSPCATWHAPWISTSTKPCGPTSSLAAGTSDRPLAREGPATDGGCRAFACGSVVDLVVVLVVLEEALVILGAEAEVLCLVGIGDPVHPLSFLLVVRCAFSVGGEGPLRGGLAAMEDHRVHSLVHTVQVEGEQGEPEVRHELAHAQVGGPDADAEGRSARLADEHDLQPAEHRADGLIAVRRGNHGDCGHVGALLARDVGHRSDDLVVVSESQDEGVIEEGVRPLRRIVSVSGIIASEPLQRYELAHRRGEQRLDLDVSGEQSIVDLGPQRASLVDVGQGAWFSLKWAALGGARPRQARRSARAPCRPRTGRSAV